MPPPSGRPKQTQAQAQAWAEAQAGGAAPGHPPDRRDARRAPPPWRREWSQQAAGQTKTRTGPAAHVLPGKARPAPHPLLPPSPPQRERERETRCTVISMARPGGMRGPVCYIRPTRRLRRSVASCLDDGDRAMGTGGTAHPQRELECVCVSVRVRGREEERGIEREFERVYVCVCVYV
jgi:hypothetical protein